MAMYMCYCFLQIGMLPKEFLALDTQEKAFIIACIDKKIEAEKKEQKNLKM